MSLLVKVVNPSLALLLIACAGAEGPEIDQHAEGLTCEEQCGEAFDWCEYVCEESYHPYYEEARYNACLDDCWDEFQRCRYQDFRNAGRVKDICHFDADLHIDGADVEFYAVDRYVDQSCAQLPDRYRKLRIDEVHCGFHSESTCANRVTNRYLSVWAPQGYTASGQNAPDFDLCPHPRL